MRFHPGNTHYFAFLILIGIGSLAINLISCKNEPASTEEETTEAAQDSLGFRKRAGKIIPFEVLNLKGEPVAKYEVFETLADGAGGTVFVFEHGRAAVGFEAGPTYRIKSAGYHPVEFQFTEIEGVNRLTFYMSKEGESADSPILSGVARKKDFRPFDRMIISADGDKNATSNTEGAYEVQGIIIDPVGFNVKYSWKDENGGDGKMGITYLQAPKNHIRLDILVDADIPETEKKYPMN